MPLQIADAVAAYVEALRTKFPVAAKQLRKGLDADAIASATADREIELPAELQALYSHFDGQKSLQLSLLPHPLRKEKGLALATLEYLGAWRDDAIGLELLYRNSSRRKTEQGHGVRATFWSRKWLPFAAGRYERDGQYLKLIVDSDPAEGGRTGQVVLETLTVTPEAEHVERQVVGDSLATYLDNVTASIRSDEILWVERLGLRWA